MRRAVRAANAGKAALAVAADPEAAAANILRE
jgi:hypothetical protein